MITPQTLVFFHTHAFVDRVRKMCCTRTTAHTVAKEMVALYRSKALIQCQVLLLEFSVFKIDFEAIDSAWLVHIFEKEKSLSIAY
jgi:hypothetical protein